ncbi:hypothetical protein Mp_1g19950 [Marchantia polymorpha subsp. ruderalis]|uniref:Uncharacterized protein n=2 Tax=Marchantia polymorpha TaxID=3197 RepID=A0AAF6AS36_MARPO|nr:hypothetical protein MARPO_0001s0332 [Marchantia polymorpha]BBM99256.1 hypothetical protein Mp_1g19950 [Marchantia polymorpha subsp. ruderalis]|eukprot:PTQ50338.1 hypothetical protein MARPO_0001s0332 [Marchantia polymorpha]
MPRSLVRHYDVQTSMPPSPSLSRPTSPRLKPISRCRERETEREREGAAPAIDWAQSCAGHIPRLSLWRPDRPAFVAIRVASIFVVGRIRGPRIRRSSKIWSPGGTKVTITGAARRSQVDLSVEDPADHNGVAQSQINRPWCTADDLEWCSSMYVIIKAGPCLCG